MIDSLRYGVPFGLFAFLTLWLYSAMQFEFSHFIRWFVVCATGTGLVTFSLRRRNQAFFPFRFGFLGAFNALIAATLVQGILIFVFIEEVAGNSPSEIEPLKWTMYHIFIEGMGFVFVGLITTAVWSLILKKS